MRLIPPIVEAKARKAGLYQTFEEFKNNTPGIAAAAFKIIYRSNHTQHWNGGGAKVLEPTQVALMNGQIKSAFGFCYQDMVYISLRQVKGIADGEEGL